MDVTYIASVLSGYCIYFAIAFHVFLGVFTSVLDVCFKCFICLRTYVANVSSKCFKSRSGVVYVAMVPVVGRQRHVIGLYVLPRATRLTLSSPLSPFPSLHLTSMLALALGWGSSRGATLKGPNMAREG